MKSRGPKDLSNFRVKGQVWILPRYTSPSSQSPLGCPNFTIKKFRFEAKLSETDTVSLLFASASRNHKKVSLHFALQVSLLFSKKAFRFGSFAEKTFALETVLLRNSAGSGSARIRILKVLLDPDPDPHGQMPIRIQEVKKPRMYKFMR